MNEIKMLREAEPQRVLQEVYEHRVPVVVSYLSGGRWRVARALLIEVSDNSFSIKFSPQKRAEPVDVKAGASVGISFKYGCSDDNDRFIFDTKVIGIEQPADSSCIGTITLSVPEQIEFVQRRSFVRVRVPESMSVDVNIWRRDRVAVADGTGAASVCQGWEGKLVDISASGLQVAVDFSQGPDLEAGQFVGLRFAPLKDETKLTFNAYVRSITPAASGKSLCIGLEMVGLEASPEGRLILQRLCNVVGQYDRMNKAAGDRR